MTSTDHALTDMLSAVFADYRKQHAGPAVADAAFWGQLTDLGLVRLTGPEESGGSGATWAEAAELLHAAAWHGVRVPLAEHDLLACWLLDTLGLETGNARRTVCVLDETSTARDVPWASWAERVVVVQRQDSTWSVADVDVRDLDISTGTNPAAEPRDQVTAPRRSGTTAPPELIHTLFLRGALARSVQICAVLDRTLELAIAHTRDRTQFGRPLTRFQAVQQLVADIASEAALARAATEAALADAVRTGCNAADLEFRIAVARSCAGHATSVVVRNAHQVHGAIGTTREHRLHEFTTAALAWRSEFGSVRHWDSVLTEAALTAARDGLWPLIAS